VADVERSKQFYGGLGWRLDSDAAPAEDVRIVQFTPPGSGCSVTFGKGITAAAPGSGAAGLIVSAIEAEAPTPHELRVVLLLQRSRRHVGNRFSEQNPDPFPTPFCHLLFSNSQQ
jgi:hypothetical protein